MPPTVQTQIAPTGGIIILNIIPSIGVDSTTANVTIQRYTNSAPTPVTIYDGLYSLIFIDDGELLPSYLDPQYTYYYIVTDSGGSTTTSGIVPLVELTVTPSWFDKILFRMFKAGIDALMPPNQFKKADVLQALPLTWGSEHLPMVVMNLDLQQQEYVQIGRDVYSSETNTQTITTVMLRRYSISILSQDAQERDYYKDVCIGIAYSIMPSFIGIGQDLSYDIQVSQTQVTQSEFNLGFYVAEVMLNMSGMFNLSVTTNYPIIQSISTIVSGTVSGQTNYVTITY